MILVNESYNEMWRIPQFLNNGHGSLEEIKVASYNHEESQKRILRNVKENSKSQVRALTAVYSINWN